MPPPVMLAVLGAVVFLVIGLFSWWHPRRSDDQAVAAERERIRTLVAQPPADEGSDKSKN